MFVDIIQNARELNVLLFDLFGIVRKHLKIRIYFCRIDLIGGVEFVDKVHFRDDFVSRSVKDYAVSFCGGDKIVVSFADPPVDGCSVVEKHRKNSRSIALVYDFCQTVTGVGIEAFREIEYRHYRYAFGVRYG